MKVYIDMDGTLTSYSREHYINNLWLEHPEVLTNLPPIIKHIPDDWIILTATSTKREAYLKKAWARHYFPNNLIITLPKDFPKYIYAENSILFDDYPKNLKEWQAHGGYSIKVLNGINSHQTSIPEYSQEELHTILESAVSPNLFTFKTPAYTYYIPLRKEDHRVDIPTSNHA